MSTIKVNSIQANTTAELDINSPLGTIPSLEVTGSASVSGVSTFSSGIVVSAGITAAPSISPTGDSNTGIFFPAADTIAFGEGGVEALRIASNANIGIGTNNPSQKLEVVGGEIKAGRVDTGSEGGQVSFGRATDNATGWYIDVYGNTSTPSLRFVDVSNAAVRMTVDGSGRVTMPYQPSFYAYQTAGASKSTTGAFTTEFNTTLLNVGSCYSTSTGRFTAPVAGVYFFQLKGLPRYGTSNNNVELTFYKNGSNVVSRSFTYASMLSTANHAQVTANLYISLAVNDYVQMGIYAVGAGTDVYYGENLGSFCGHLVG